ncbi:MAG: tetratricopeptide repeat protein [Planctomycetes bacterium]|nr:tetratricopeptide repeat protein [Planctomycetota bacterium]
MKATPRAFVVWLALVPMARAQDLGPDLAAAEAKIAATEWQDALRLLLDLRDRAKTTEGAHAVADALDRLTLAALRRAAFEPALRAGEAALATRTQACGGVDDPRVASAINNLGGCLLESGRSAEALSQFELGLAMCRRLHGDADHADVALSLNNVAASLQVLGRYAQALECHEEAMAIRHRIHGDADHADVALSLNNVAGALRRCDRPADALPLLEQALAMRRRLHGEEHATVAESLNNLGHCLHALGRTTAALAQFEASLSLRRRLHDGRDHPQVAVGLSSVADCLEALGRLAEALQLRQQALAMRQRLHGDGDHPEVAQAMQKVGYCLRELGRLQEALPIVEGSLAMRRRLHRGSDHPDLSFSLNSVGSCLRELGRTAEALPLYEESLAMRKRIHGGGDHSTVAMTLNGVALCLRSLGRADEALPLLEESLAMRRRIHANRDHADVATALHNLAVCLHTAGWSERALALNEQSLAMRRRLLGERDHPAVADSLHAAACCLDSLGRAAEALPRHESALAMWKRLYGDRDHPDVAVGLNGVAGCLESLGRGSEALPQYESAVAMIERLRDETRLSPDFRQSLFEDLKRDGAFEAFQRLAGQLGRPMDAAHAAERSRGRGLLDQLGQFADPEVEAERRARQRGDEAGAMRLSVLRNDLEAARAESDRLLHELTKLAEQADVPDRESRREALLAQSNAASTTLRQLLDERARLLGDVLPVGRVRTPADLQSVLQSDELLLEFTVTRDVAMLYVFARKGTVDAIELPKAFATTRRLVPALLWRSSHAQLRGRDPEPGAAPVAATDASSTELFASLIPSPVWERVRKSRRVFVAAHRELHRVPFELLVTSVKDGKPSYWLDEGPPISYVPSGTLLHWLRQRAQETADDQTSLDLLAVGDPRALDAESPVPEQGVFVRKVYDGGEAARIGLQPGDVLTSYDEKPLADDRSLRDVRMETEKAIEDGKRGDAPIPIGVWRRGAVLQVDAKPGQLGIEVGPGKARSAFEASLGSVAQAERITRAGDLERLHALPPLLGARAETEAIEKVFADRKAKTRRLLGAEASEPAVFDLAAKAKYLHFACHGIAEEYAGQSLSMLVLSQPQHVLPADDGLLKLADLWSRWRGRLSSCRLVVLSACRTNVATTQRDEAPQALPIGFFFAGVPSVISSLWAVDDESTRELMSDFYGRLLAGETDKLEAFTDSKKALRAKYPDPFHWAPFLFLGAPE